MPTALLTVRQVSKSFGPKQVLDRVNLTIRAGTITSLIGPSGAGKTTLIKTALGMDRPDTGEAQLTGHRMPNRQALSQLGYMAQTDALYLTLTARENLAFFGRLKGLTGKNLSTEVTRLLTLVDLTPAANQRVSGYSGGMRRRLSLAIAMLGQPPLLILDEPTVGIDPALRRQIWRELGRLRNTGRGILVTTHVMSEAEQVDQVALLMQGHVIANASPAKLKQDYQVPTLEDVFLTAERGLVNAQSRNH